MKWSDHTWTCESVFSSEVKRYCLDFFVLLMAYLTWYCRIWLGFLKYYFIYKINSKIQTFFVWFLVTLDKFCIFKLIRWCTLWLVIKCFYPGMFTLSFIALNCRWSYLMMFVCNIYQVIFKSRGNSEPYCLKSWLLAGHLLPLKLLIIKWKKLS